MKNFIGQDGFVWWIGIVESIDDPLVLGRCRVRCFGYHPAQSTNLVPTTDLPWALSIHPLNTPNLYGTPRLGDWVFGFFLDSLSAQEPAILGYLPAIPAEASAAVTGRVTEEATEYFGTPPTNMTRSFASVSNRKDILWEINNSKITIANDSGNMTVKSLNKMFFDANNITSTTSNAMYFTANSTIATTANGIYTVANTISLNAITITTSANTIESFAKYINLTADDVFNISASNTLSLSSSDLNLTADDALNISSNTLSLSSSSDLNLADKTYSTTLTEIMNRLKALEEKDILQDVGIAVAMTLPQPNP